VSPADRYAAGRPSAGVLLFLTVVAFLLSIAAVQAISADQAHSHTGGIPHSAVTEAGASLVQVLTTPAITSGVDGGVVEADCHFLGLVCAFGFIALVTLAMTQNTLRRQMRAPMGERHHQLAAFRTLVPWLTPSSLVLHVIRR
jgi:membrane associated rhomboid family serine protease